MLIWSPSKFQIVCKHTQISNYGLFGFVVLYTIELVIELAISHEEVEPLLYLEMGVTFEVDEEFEGKGFHEDDDGCVYIECILSSKCISNTDILSY